MNVSEVLAQALHVNDIDAIYSHLEGCSQVDKKAKGKARSIHDTISSLSNDSCISLLQFLSNRLESNPRSAAVLLPWITELLVLKRKLFLSTLSVSIPPDGALVRIYLALQQRTESFQQLLQLSGRLDVLLSRVDSSSGSKDVVKSTRKHNEESIESLNADFAKTILEEEEEEEE